MTDLDLDALERLAREAASDRLYLPFFHEALSSDVCLALIERVRKAEAALLARGKDMPDPRISVSGMAIEDTGR